MKKGILLFIFCLLTVKLMAQKYSTDKSFVSFFSHASIEDISAENKKASGIFNASTTDIAFSIPVIEFKFAKALMQEHFNEKYMESDKYPKSTFQGKIIGYDNSKNAGVQPVRAVGKLTIHGVTKDVDQPGTIEKQGDKVLMKSTFRITLQDYNVTVPQLLWKNIADHVDVTVDFLFKPL